MQDKNTKSLRVDGKGRVSLGAFIPDGTTSLRVHLTDNGETILTPMVELPVQEAWLWNNKAAMASVRAGLAQIEQGKTNPLNLADLPGEED